MTEGLIIGVDRAKQVFQGHDTTVEGEVVFRKKLLRNQSLAFTQAHPGLAWLQSPPFQVSSPYPAPPHATRLISAVASALKRFMSAARMWTSAACLSGSRDVMRSPKDLRWRIFASICVPCDGINTARLQGPQCSLWPSAQAYQRQPGPPLQSATGDGRTRRPQHLEK